jgi:amino acid transporter
LKPRQPLGLAELIAIAVGGMIGGGIFSILGIAAKNLGGFAPLAIALGGGVAFFAAYSYVKLAIYYKDEGATYAFFKRTFSRSPFAASVIGWYVVFGYISTLALYAFTFASYTGSLFSSEPSGLIHTTLAGIILGLFMAINLWSTKGMGRIEDLLVYVKLVLLLMIAIGLFYNGSVTQYQMSLPSSVSFGALLTTASITFVAYEGFQLVIHAMNEVDHPEKNVPLAIYSAGGIVAAIYILLAVGALFCIPLATLISDKEYALAGGAQALLGTGGYLIVIIGAILATTSAINGTLFGAARLMAVIADDGYLPRFLGRRGRGRIPYNAILLMGGIAFALIALSRLEVILEFGSVTFLLVSFLMAYANFVKRKETRSNSVMVILAMATLLTSAVAILWNQYEIRPETLFFTLGIYVLLTLAASAYAKFMGPQGRKAPDPESQSPSKNS